jgi:hypothetical protein
LASTNLLAATNEVRFLFCTVSLRGYSKLKEEVRIN